jgi:peptidoglycan hydrolase-like protein with peptidoglycan-binding domain
LSKLKSGQRDSDSVKNLQKALNAHSLRPPGNITLPVTGNFGPKTDQVVIACQQQHGFGNDRPGAVSVGPGQAAHLGLPGVRP